MRRPRPVKTFNFDIYSHEEWNKYNNDRWVLVNGKKVRLVDGEWTDINVSEDELFMDKFKTKGGNDE